MKPGRNDPCPCGSGRKYKRCCAERLESLSGAAAAAPSPSPGPSRGEAQDDATQMARNAAGDDHATTVAGYHLEVLLDEVQVGGLAFKELFTQCMQASATSVPRWKLPRRAFRALNLARYFCRSLAIDGARAECGTLKGFSALLMSRLAQAADAGFAGERMHIVDSFEGLSAPQAEDAVADPTAKNRKVFPAAKGAMACPLEHVRSVLQPFPQIEFHQGWIPEVLKQLPETRWAFVHIDVDLYEPTLGCLEYFVPRLAPGGIIVNDDYASPLFPGGGLAWDQYCSKHRLAFAALDTGQTVLVQGV